MNPTAQHTYEEVDSPNMLAHNNAGAHRSHTSVPFRVDTNQQPTQPTYDSLESPHQDRVPQPYEVSAIRSNPAVPQDNQYAEIRQNMNQHATQNEHTQSTVRREYADPDVHHSHNSPTSNLSDP